MHLSSVLYYIPGIGTFQEIQLFADRYGESHHEYSHRSPFDDGGRVFGAASERYGPFADRRAIARKTHDLPEPVSQSHRHPHRTTPWELAGPATPAAR